MPALRLDRRAFLRGTGGAALALPILDAMGAEVTIAPRRRFCALYTTNGVSLPRAEHGLDEWSWFPRAEKDGQFVFGKSTEPLAPFRRQLSFLGGLYHPSGPKADPHVCSETWLTGAPLREPKPGTYNSVGLDQVVALHTRQHCRQPSLVLSIDAGTGSLSRTGTISYNLEGRPIPAENNPRRVFDLIALAFDADITRSVAFMLNREDGMGISDTFPLKLGLSQTHHSLSHAGDKAGQLAFARYDRLLSEQVAHFLRRLTEYRDRTGPVLDNTIVRFSSGASTTHNPRNLPTLVAGGAALGLRHGAYWRAGETRLSNAYLRILRSLGIPAKSFADSTGPLTGSIFGRA